MIAIYKNDLINVLRKVKQQCDTDYVSKSAGQGLSSNDYTTAEKEKLASLPAASDIVTKETGKGLSSNDYTTSEKEKLASVPASESIVVLDANGKVPLANLPLEFTALETVATYSDLPVTGLFNGRRIMVLDASGDPTVVSGFAVYVYSSGTSSWTKIVEGESLDVNTITDWSNITNKPNDLLHETDVVDNLTSTSTTDALSANQGKELKTLVDGKVSSVAEGSTNGTVKIDGTTDVAVHGLQSGAYQKIEVVAALPASPDSDTLYFILE